MTGKKIPMNPVKLFHAEKAEGPYAFVDTIQTFKEVGGDWVSTECVLRGPAGSVDLKISVSFFARALIEEIFSTGRIYFFAISCTEGFGWFSGTIISLDLSCGVLQFSLKPTGRMEFREFKDATVMEAAAYYKP